MSLPFRWAGTAGCLPISSLILIKISRGNRLPDQYPLILEAENVPRKEEALDLEQNSDKG